MGYTNACFELGLSCALLFANSGGGVSGGDCGGGGNCGGGGDLVMVVVVIVVKVMKLMELVKVNMDMPLV